MQQGHGVRWDAPIAAKALNAPAGVRWDAPRSATKGVGWDAPRFAFAAAGVRWDAPRFAAAGVRWDAPRFSLAGVRWDAPAPRLAATALLLLAMLAMLLAPAVSAGSTTPVADTARVIVRTAPGAVAAVEQLVTSLGGTVLHRLDALETVTARMPADRVPALQRSSTVRGVTGDSRVQMLSTAGSAGVLGTAVNVSKMTGARAAWAKGLTGKGVGVALIDTGVVPVKGLRAPNLHMGPDLSPEGQFPAVHGLDTFGHGTHMAGLIAGGSGAAVRNGLTAAKGHVGTAPDATLLSIKVAGSDGATDVSQVLAAINWVIEHRNDKNMNIRVLNLSFGTDGRQSYLVDPLTYAAEVAWRKGIVVVTAAGNSGKTGRLSNPAYDPHLLAVGASDHRGTVRIGDDRVATFSSRGVRTRRPDLVAPGRSIVSYRNANSAIDAANPEGRVNAELFKGSGTSQAAAIVSGAAALVLQQRPGLTPDQVKRLLTSTARALPAGDKAGQGAGLVNVAAALTARTPAKGKQPFRFARGTGSLDAARGTQRLVDGAGTPLVGEVDVQDARWNGNTWSGNTWSGNTWSGGEWNGNTWSGNTWSGNTWSGNTWSGNTWSGNTWSGNTWSGNTWSGNTWSGNTWSGNTWSGNTWSGNTWSGNTWSGNTWSGNTWSGNTWSGNTWSGNTWSGNTWSGNTWSGNTWSGSAWLAASWA